MELKIATFNIQHGRDHPHGLKTGEEKIDLALMAETIRKMDVDLCGLNEVRNQDFCNQAEEIAKILGWHYVFCPAIEIRNGTYGNALVSRFPIKAVRAVPITTSFLERNPLKWYEDRVILVATVDVEGKEITVMSSHFGLHEIEMEKATQTVLREAEGIASPLLFMGDLNMTPDDEKIRRLQGFFTDSATVGTGNLWTFPSHEPDRKIDYIFAKNARVLSCEVPNLVAADHLPVKAILEI
ncbi:MAG: endonuclease/exonuclease/phosphatase family protein [Clostridia bacterium]|nr:endonuclease/exonuclease/phosphatase family protein [Clostridia bacterium]